MKTLIINSKDKLLYEYEAFFSFLGNEKDNTVVTTDPELLLNGKKLGYDVKRLRGFNRSEKIDLIICLGWNPVLRKKNMRKLPLIIVATSRPDLEKLVITSNLYKIVVTFSIQKGDFSSKKIPKEYLAIIPFLKAKMNLNVLPKKRGSTIKILFIPASGQLDKLMSACIPVVNMIENCSVTVALPRGKISRYEPLFNSHIRTIGLNHLRSDFKIESFDLCIASDGWAKMALRCGVALILLGNNGLEGLVNGSDIEKILEYDFQGRAGGSILEDVPQVLLESEILFFKNLTINDRELLIKNIARKVQAITKQTNHSNKFNELVQHAVKLHELLYNSKKLLDSKPRLVDNIGVRINSVTNVHELYNRHTGQVLLNISEPVFHLISTIIERKSRTIDDEIAMLELPFLQQLFEKKAIVLDA